MEVALSSFARVGGLLKFAQEIDEVPLTSLACLPAACSVAPRLTVTCSAFFLAFFVAVLAITHLRVGSVSERAIIDARIPTRKVAQWVKFV